MESMENDRNKDETLKRVHAALHQLREERKQRGMVDVQEDEEDLLLSSLLLQLESLEKEAIPSVEEPKGSVPSVPSKHDEQECGKKEVGMDEIARELRRVKRQNEVTHRLLTAMIVLTAAWQFGEVAILLTAKEKLSHPLRSIGEFVKAVLKGKGKRPRIEGTPLPPIPVPDLSRLELSVLPLDPEK